MCNGGTGGTGGNGSVLITWSDPNLPTVTSPTATGITSGGAVLGANVTSNGGGALTACGTCWGTSPSPAGNCAAEGGTATGVFTHARSGMPLGTLIYYRGYATNSAGTSYSSDGNFTTSLPGITFTTAVTVSGTFTVTGAISKGSGSFVIDHPLDPKNKLLYHSFVESPDVKNIYDGVTILDEEGKATVTLPTYFMALNKDFRYQVKPINKPSPNLYIEKEIEDGKFSIAGGNPGEKISWQITGIRHDPYILANPIIVEVEKGPNTPVKKGEYLYPELYATNSFSGVFGNFINLFKGLIRQLMLFSHD